VKKSTSSSYRKGAWIAGAVLLTASISGFFMGLRQTSSQISMTRPVSLAVPEPERTTGLASGGGDVPVAVSYSQQDWLRDGPNKDWKNRLTSLVPPAAPAVGLTNVTEAERNLSLHERQGRRAFEGAPPVVPHSIPQDSSAVCLACHGAGLAVKDKVASRISHTRYQSCTQCHVSAAGLGVPLRENSLLIPLAENDFVPVPAPSKGARAWPTAPPSIPHSTLMRNDCLSCHGPGGLFGLRTPHPDRQSCLQCHPADAQLDQRVFATSIP